MNKLKEFMSTATTVDEWNELRDVAKKSYTSEEISWLDCSGFIKTLNLE